MRSIPRRTAIKSLAALLGLGAAAPSAAEQRPGIRFELYKTAKGFRWRLKAANNQTIATPGEDYTTKAACRNAIDLIKRSAAGAPVEEIP